MTIEPAKRTGTIPLVGMYGKSGSGKTMSALLMARGLCGPEGKIVVIDTENKRASLYADLVPGGYQVINLEPPFTPERYIEALDIAAQQATAVIMDSVSHLWDGEGGVLEAQEAELSRMAGDDFRKREACKMAAWIKPKQRYKKWFQRVLRFPVPLICCLRASEKTTMEKKDGKTVVKTDEFSTPIFDHRFIFEMLCNLEVVQDDTGKPGMSIVRKWSHPDLLTHLPKKGEQIAVRHGEALAKWCSGETSAPPTSAKPKQATEQKTAKKALWDATKHIHKCNLADLEAWLKKHDLLGEGEKLADCDERQLNWMLEQIANIG